ncbi:MAG: HAD family hydrolase [Thaumarchaeota archaeon]|nr:HAD family hydrolase [Nitrososphaerota archaeon]
MKPKAVMFDWDGVLMDSLGAAFNVYDKIFARIGTRRLTQEEFLAVQSPNWYEFYQRIGVPEKLWKEVDSEWVRLYEEEDPQLHTDAMRCLTALKKSGFRLALVSNGSKGRVDGELEKFRLVTFFDSVIFGARKEELKPSPFMLDKTLGALGISPESAVYVGDSPADIQAAKNARVSSIALARGPIQVARLRAENPDLMFDGLDGLTDFLTRGT